MLEVIVSEACDEATILINNVSYDWEYDLLRQGHGTCRRCVTYRITNLECAIAWAARDYYTNVEPL